ncbi:hypothetical protein Barba22A_gp132 [Rheinheimera phage vB_RspM_Barba22A]|jgi:hypothetical protein|uniref:Uncharacterized protein n=80 Tax=Barbavirus TaxID=2733095 RepID=A0A7G9VS21_9CAUD|nr:hypothetical protein HOV44_gp141 [Rheinheimera phage Barba5S]YP_009822873.1 hypothetical protein HOV45_gp137 [Rheinheimera phage Barba8S]YP_009823009.1 hypothetical protein HOV46_gp132 [Rheinheimera phage vB_RspM_Barba18A]YP_009823292.1 hypothetical protein HOV48_gp136 [Rheinheimera phage Barba21A]QCQ57983.1 hypothetical protein Barba1A_gp132 [Rheinheimera phage vB_RspM_Barba1A]QCQ58119.1 hypothetical protein Barba1S_gp132 [Rheinheimera phage vB_RspM_Barba1S]QCQ58255.1 hypothetical protein
MFRFSNQPIVSSKFVFGVGNFGVLYDVVPTTGQNGAAVLLNDGGVNGDYVRLRIDSIDPTITSLFVYEDGSFESQGTGQWTYYYSENGIENPTLNTVTINPFVTDSNISIADTLPSLLSSISLNPPYALFTETYNNNQYVSIPAKVATAISADVDDSSRIDFRIKFKLNSTVGGTLYQGTSDTSFLKIQSATTLVYRMSNGGYEAITLSTPITLNTLHELHFRRYKSGTEGTVVEVELDGVIVGRQINRSAVAAGLENTPDKLGPFQTGTVVYECTLQGFRYINNVDDLQTTWGDGTLVNYPADSSKWILYDNTYPPEPAESNVTISDVLPSLLSSISLNYLSNTNLSIAENFGALQSSVTLTYQSEDSNLTISDVLPALSSSVTITNVVPEYNISISDSFSPLQSSMSLVNGIPESSLSIATTLPSLSSSVSIENVVPTYSLAITTSLPSLQSAVGLSYEDAIYDITISDNLPSLQSTITLENIVPVYTLEITDSFAALQSSVNIINGELTIHVAPQNLIYIKPKPRFITLR